MRALFHDLEQHRQWEAVTIGQLLANPELIRPGLALIAARQVHVSSYAAASIALAVAGLLCSWSFTDGLPAEPLSCTAGN